MPPLTTRAAQALLLSLVCACDGLHISSSGADAEVYARLSNWVKQRGGVVHESLRLSVPAPCGASRGVVASAVISLEEALTEPLIVVPEV
jgi:hypothetical protein